MRTIDLNCDLGEGAGNDAELIPLVSSVNVACGGHAGDDATMRAAVRGALAAGVNVGAHPGYEDRAGFGRAEVAMTPGEVEAMVARQVCRLCAIAADEGATLRHVKPHGALYHAADRDAAVADAVVRAMTPLGPSLLLVGPPGGALAAAAGRAGLAFVAEGFADRRYRPDGTLVPRGTPGAVIEDHRAAAAQAVGLARDGRVTADDGTAVSVPVRTLCVHGDGAAAVATLVALRSRLAADGIAVRPFTRHDGV